MRDVLGDGEGEASVSRYTDEREPNTRPYDWGRIATEAQVISHLEKLGAVDLRDKLRTNSKEPLGFEAGRRPLGGGQEPYGP